MQTPRILPLTALILACAPLATQAGTPSEPVVLKLAHSLPPMSAAHTRFIVPWCERIEVQSGGRMKCQIYPAMSLGGAPAQLLQQARDGIADITWTLPGWTPGRFPLSEVFELPFFTSDRESSSRALWDFVEHNAMSEFAGLKPIGTWVTGPYVFHFRDREVRNLDDFKGLKVRAPSRLGNKMLAALGATPVGMPVPQMPESLAKGVIGGALVPWEVVPPTKTHELTRFHAEAAGDRTMLAATMIFAMNRKKYDSLPDDLKKVIDDNSGRDTSAWIAAQFEPADTAAREMTVARGNAVYAITPEEMRKWQAATRDVTEEWIREVPNGQQHYDAAAALVARYAKP